MGNAAQSGVSASPPIERVFGLLANLTNVLAITSASARRSHSVDVCGRRNKKADLQGFWALNKKEAIKYVSQNRYEPTNGKEQRNDCPSQL
jgi:hypothetical protein